MLLFKLITRNALRHKLRTSLTVAGLVVAILAFGLLQTVVDAWYGGANAASANRLITRNKVSLTFPMPATYLQKIRSVEGVESVAAANWFGGVYRDTSMANFFPKFAVDAVPYFAMYPEYLVKENEFRDFLRDRQGAMIGRKLATAHGFKVGDVIPIQGDIFPGNWNFTVRGIYDGGQKSTDTSALFFHYQYLNETLRQRALRRADAVGVFVVAIKDVDRAAEISKAIDQLSENSSAETLTETEKAFQIGFAKQTEAIVIAIRFVSFVVIFIILAIMANVMSLTVRERMAEYATLKALGFKPAFVVSLILGESVAIAVLGAAIGIGLSFPLVSGFGALLGNLFPIFDLSGATIVLQAICALAVGLIAAALPMRRAAKVQIVEGLRFVG
ncbi:MAG TPA: FtsX-like permease family protein [Burkholderiales bacterium]|nr:FtsX-like permease family protein [Burkholderiales bacterium]